MIEVVGGLTRINPTLHRAPHLLAGLRDPHQQVIHARRRRRLGRAVGVWVLVVMWVLRRLWVGTYMDGWIKATHTRARAPLLLQPLDHLLQRRVLFQAGGRLLLEQGRRHLCM